MKACERQKPLNTSPALGVAPDFNAVQHVWLAMPTGRIIWSTKTLFRGLGAFYALPSCNLHQAA